MGRYRCEATAKFEFDGNVRNADSRDAAENAAQGAIGAWKRGHKAIGGHGRTQSDMDLGQSDIEVECYEI